MPAAGTSNSTADDPRPRDRSVDYNYEGFENPGGAGLAKAAGARLSDKLDRAGTKHVRDHRRRRTAISRSKKAKRSNSTTAKLGAGDEVRFDQVLACGDDSGTRSAARRSPALASWPKCVGRHARARSWSCKRCGAARIRVAARATASSHTTVRVSKIVGRMSQYGSHSSSCLACSSTLLQGRPGSRTGEPRPFFLGRRPPFASGRQSSVAGPEARNFALRCRPSCWHELPQPKSWQPELSSAFRAAAAMLGLAR